MHVNRVLPPARIVLEDPSLNRIPLNGEARLLTRSEPAVDSPLAVISFEPENACHHWRRRCHREVVEIDGLARRDIRGVDAVVSHDWTIDNNLQDLVALPGTYNVASWT